MQGDLRALVVSVNKGNRFYKVEATWACACRMRYLQTRCIVRRKYYYRESGEKAMATFISLVNWTDQGIRNVKDTIQRYERGEEIANKHGVTNEQIYWTLGPYDMVFIAQAPDAESITSYLLEVGSAGNLRTTTLRGYHQEEMRGMLERIG